MMRGYIKPIHLSSYKQMKRFQALSAGGFTLIEVLISLSITAVIVSLLYGTFRTTIQSAQDIDKQADAYRISRVVFYQLAKDIRMIYQKKTAKVTQQIESDPPFGALSFKAEDDVRLAEGDIYPADTLHFTTLSFQPVSKGIPLSGQAEISYSLSEQVLTRNARFREKSVANDLSESVLGLNFRFFDAKKNEWVDEWEPVNTIPQAIEIELTIKTSPSLSPTQTLLDVPLQKRSFKTTVEIPASEAL